MSKDLAGIIFFFASMCLKNCPTSPIFAATKRRCKNFHAQGVGSRGGGGEGAEGGCVVLINQCTHSVDIKHLSGLSVCHLFKSFRFGISLNQTCMSILMVLTFRYIAFKEICF